MRAAVLALLLLACAPAETAETATSGAGGDEVECCFPSATFDVEEAPCGGYDWTCDGVEEPVADHVIDCASVPYDDCGHTGEFGWVDEVPACGEEGIFSGGCGGEPVQQVCVPAEPTPKIQACR